jgi:hypothetical protein
MEERKGCAIFIHYVPKPSIEIEIPDIGAVFSCVTDAASPSVGGRSFQFGARQSALPHR